MLLKRRLVANRLLLLLSLLLLSSSRADAAGLYFSDRGVRPLGRGGAFVAGADDLGAMWYNPAGLADAGTSILSDFSWLHFTSEFTRRSQSTDLNGTVRNVDYPTVNGTSPVLPIPTLGVSYAFGEKKQWTGAFGIIAPYTAITSYPLTVNGQPSPSRYSLVSLDGSALVIPGLYMAYKPIEEVRVGIGVQALVGTFASTQVFSSCPADHLVCAPEDPAYDTFAQLKAGPIFAPSGNAGVTLVPEKHVRIGISGQLPFTINAPATVQVKLPNAVVFDKAQQVGTDAHIRFKLPAILRAGIEGRNEFSNKSLLRVEAAYVREFWSAHDAITITPDNITLVNIQGFPSPFGVAPISLPRNFKDSNSFRLGGEYTAAIGSYVIDFRLGVDYEQSAVPNAYLSPLTIDLDKVMLGIGGGLHIGEHLRLDGVYAHVFTGSATVSPSEAAVPRVNPVRGNATPVDAINGGAYSARADVLGVGLNYKF
jgi:long-chain fatty acid transport protein